MSTPTPADAATSNPSSATPETNTNPNTDSTLVATPPSSLTSTAIDRIRTWWENYITWREDVKDNQISCNCPISGPCRCEAGQVTVAGPS